MSNLRSDCRDLVKARAPGDMWRTHIERLCHQIDEVEQRWHEAESKLRAVRKDLEAAVCVEGVDKGVLLMSCESDTHNATINGREHVVYNNPFFSEMGEALVEAHAKCLSNSECEVDSAKEHDSVICEYPSAVYKYPLKMISLQRVLMPQDAKIISVANQDGVICVWAVGNLMGPTNPMEDRLIEIAATGRSVLVPAGVDRVFIGTAFMFEEVWHLFERR